MIDVQLRDLSEPDLPVVFELQRDALASRMAAFGTRDADAQALGARWKKALTDSSTRQMAIVQSGEVVGFVATFRREGRPEVTYWIARSHWGRGIATAALTRLLEIVTERPMYAGAARDNVGSLRVLEKCGFAVVGSERAFAEARGEEIDEVLLELT